VNTEILKMLFNYYISFSSLGVAQKYALSIFLIWVPFLVMNIYFARHHQLGLKLLRWTVLSILLPLVFFGASYYLACWNEGEWCGLYPGLGWMFFHPLIFLLTQIVFFWRRNDFLKGNT